MPFQPKFSISVKTAAALIAIERTRGFLEAATLSDYWLAQMQSRALVLEAHHTTHIEGTHLTLDQSEKLIAGDTLPSVDLDDSKELLNYIDAFDFVAEYVSGQGPITESLIREIHRRLVQNVRGGSAEPGMYRAIQNYVANGVTREIIYTPPEPFEVPVLMKELVEWLEADQTKELPAVIVSGIAQFQLVHIHPFVDGNGRTSRLLSTLYLYKAGYDFRKLFTISEYYDRNRMDFYEAIQSVRENDMDMTGWLEYFSKALESQMHEIQDRGTLAMKLDVLVLKYELSMRQKCALESMLIPDRKFTTRDYEKICPDVTRRSLQRDLTELVEKGIIRQSGSTRALHYEIANLDL